MSRTSTAPPARKPSAAQPAVKHPAKPSAVPITKVIGPLPPPKPIQPPPPAAAAVELNPTPLQGRIYQPVDIACPHQNDDLTNCGAAENEPCLWQQPGMAGTFHAERIACAAAASRGSGLHSTQEDFDQAVQDSGLV